MDLNNSGSQSGETFDEYRTRIDTEEAELMNDFNQKLNRIVIDAHNQQLTIWKKGEEDLLTSLDNALKEFETKVRGKVSLSKEEAKSFIRDAFEEFGMKAWLAKYQANGQAIFDLDNMQYDTIRDFRVYIEEQKVEIRTKFAQIYAIIEKGKQDALEN